MGQPPLPPELHTFVFVSLKIAERVSGYSKAPCRLPIRAPPHGRVNTLPSKIGSASQRTNPLTSSRLRPAHPLPKITYTSNPDPPQDTIASGHPNLTLRFSSSVIQAKTRMKNHEIAKPPPSYLDSCVPQNPHPSQKTLVTPALTKFKTVFSMVHVQARVCTKVTQAQSPCFHLFKKHCACRMTTNIDGIHGQTDRLLPGGRKAHSGPWGQVPLAIFKRVYVNKSCHRYQICRISRYDNAIPIR